MNKEAKIIIDELDMGFAFKYKLSDGRIVTEDQLAGLGLFKP